MLPKPRHLGPDYAAWFKDPDVVTCYPNRPPYPAEVFDLLASLAVDRPRVVLDVGCGTGDVARPLAPRVERVDAVDFSAAMIAKAKELPGGDDPRIRWIVGPVEEAPLAPPYALITAGESLHWLAWEVVFPRFVRALAPSGALAIVERDWDRAPGLRDRLVPIFRRYGANRDFRPYDLIEELERRDLFGKRGDVRTKPVPWQPTVDEFLACRHSQNSFARFQMGPTADEFDRAIRDALDALVREGQIAIRHGRLALEVDARVVWGKPLAGRS
jgi:SAM-dependent methyltransferase